MEIDYERYFDCLAMMHKKTKSKMKHFSFCYNDEGELARYCEEVEYDKDTGDLIDECRQCPAGWLY